MKVLIRADAGPQLGLGHLTRALALARALVRQPGTQVAFLSCPDPLAEGELAKAGLEVHLKPAGLLEELWIDRALDRLPTDVLVIDGKYPYSPAWIRGLRQRCRVVMIDHPGDGSFEADLVIFPIAHLAPEITEDARWGSSHARLLHGPEYVVLNEAVLSLRRSEMGQKPPGFLAHRSCRTPPRVVVTTGGSDPKGVMLAVLGWWSDLPVQAEVVALVGQSFVHREALERLRPILSPSIEVRPYSPEPLWEADLAVCTFGITTYELIYLGVPALNIGHVPENAAASRILAERYGATVDLGLIDFLDRERFSAELRRWLSDEAGRAHMAERGRWLIDGQGAERIARRIEGVGGRADG